MKYQALKATREQRRKAVLASLMACRTWADKFARPAQRVLKRPSAVSASSVPLVVKRHAGLGGRLGLVSLSRAAPSSAAASSSALYKRPRSLHSFTGYKEVEEQVGDRYRREVSDKGVGLAKDSMQQKLQNWGHEEWLKRYRMGVGNAVDRTVAVYVLSQQDLMRCAHVNGLEPDASHKRYLEPHGVYADRANLIWWLKAHAQQLAVFENNEEVHDHAYGEYVLEQLQLDNKPEVVVGSLRKEYLVATTNERVLAYRRYREQRGNDWTVE